MPTNRIYLVTTKTGRHLVEAPNPSRAIRHVTHAGVTCEAASPMDVAKAMNEGVKLESAGSDESPADDGSESQSN